MDWGTHLILADKLLEACGLEQGAAIYSMLPAIDSKPPEFHRVYAHIIENAPAVIEAGKGVFTRTPCRPGYEKDRVEEEEGKFLSLLEELLGTDYVISRHDLSISVSLISHLFFDTFNNPVQAFLPYSSLASGQWRFWESIDYLRFRKEFYQKESIEVFRLWAASSVMWSIREELVPEAVLKAMIIRIGELGSPPVPYEAIDWTIRKFLRYLDVDDYQRVDREIVFLKFLEEYIAGYLIKEFPK